MSDSEFERLFPMSYRDRNPENGQMSVHTWSPINKQAAFLSGAGMGDRPRIYDPRMDIQYIMRNYGW
jgi:hypothetical protein